MIRRVRQESRRRLRRLLCESLEARLPLSADGAGVQEWIARFVPPPHAEGNAQSLLQQQLVDRGLQATLQKLPIANGWLVALANGVHDARSALQTVPGIIDIEPNQRVAAAEFAAPDDPRFAEQYALQNSGQESGMPGADINAFGAWQLAAETTGSVGSRQIVTAIVDSGIDYTHPDLYLNVWINQGEIPAAILKHPEKGDSDGLSDTDGDGLITFVDLNDPTNSAFVTDHNKTGYIDAGDLVAADSPDPRWENGIDDDGPLCLERSGSTECISLVDDLIGWDFSDQARANSPNGLGDNDPFDENGHGTHVAGTIAAIGNATGRRPGEAEQGIAGLNWAASVMPVRFLDSNNDGGVADAIHALNYTNLIARNDRAQLRTANNSWGLRSSSAALREKINESEDAGLLIVAAAGNGTVLGSGIDTDIVPFYPASYRNDNVISVAASDSSDTLARFSNFGPESVDIAAPGVRVLSTEPNGEYGFRTGTSMAAPHVTGVASLLWSRVPNASVQEIKQAIFAGAQAKEDYVGLLREGSRLSAAGALAGDVFAPKVQLAGAGDVTGESNRLAYRFTVTVRDDAALVLSSFDDRDFVIRRTGPFETELSAQFVQFVGSVEGQSERTAEYEVAIPGGWSVFDNGTYEILLAGDETIVDASGRSAVLVSAPEQRRIGTFEVALDVEPMGEVFVVDSFGDSVDADLGDGRCVDAAGSCSLRAAVQQANALPGEQTIQLMPGTYQLSIADDPTNIFSRAESGDLDITDSLRIIGPGPELATIDVGMIDRFLEATEGVDLILSGFTVTGGKADSGGAIKSSADVLLQRMVFKNNVAPSGGALDLFNLDASTLNPKAGVAVHDDASGQGYIMLSWRWVDFRFAESGVPHPQNDRNLIAVQHFDGKWHYSNDVSWIPFQPDDDDFLIASVDFDADSITSLKGVTDTIHGMRRGYAEGNAEFFANRFAGVEDVGEFTVKGSFVSRTLLPRVTIFDSRFQNNGVAQSDSSFDSGGAIDVWGTRLLVRGSAFEGNSSGAGGAISVNGSFASVIDSRFTDNKATHRFGMGGAIEAYAIDLFVTDSDFEGNTTLDDGGAIAVAVGGSIDVAKSQFKENRAGSSGGAIYQLAGSRLNVHSAEFLGNESHFDGGAITSSADAITISDGVFLANRAVPTADFNATSGGALELGGDGTVSIEQTTFLGNMAVASGGALELGLREQQSHIRNSLFLDNAARFGGAVAAAGTLVVEQSQFLNNRAPSRLENEAPNGGSGIGSGGAIRASSIGRLTLLDSVVSGNSAVLFGGGIQASGEVRIGGSIIAGNTGAKYGPNIYGGFESLGGNLIGTATSAADSVGLLAHSLLGTLYADANDDGRRSSGELPLAGWTVFLDTSQPRNRKLDPGEIQTTTNLDGEFVFRDLPPDLSYDVIAVAEPGWQQTAPDPADKDVPEELRGLQRIFLGTGDIAAGLDFGFKENVSGSGTTGVVTGRVFVDVEGNGFFDGKDTGLAGRKVFLESVDGNRKHDADEKHFAVTDADGFYRIPNVEPKQYAVVTEPADQDVQTGPLTNRLRNVASNAFEFRDVQYVVAGDFDGVGAPDLVVTDSHSQKNHVVLLRGDETGAYTAAVLPGKYNTPGAITLARLNRDSTPDIIVSNVLAKWLTVLLSQPDGSFRATEIEIGYGQNFVAARDLVGDDGLDEIYVALSEQRSSARRASITMLRSVGDGTFSSPTVVAEPGFKKPVHIEFADIVGDAADDLIVTSFDKSTVAIYKNLDGQFVEPRELATGDSPLFVVATDLDGDSRLDLAVADYGADTLSLYMNDPHGRGVKGDLPDRPMTIHGVRRPSAIVAADIDGDGDTDLVTPIENSRKRALSGASTDSPTNELALVRNLGKAQFSDVLTTSGTANLSVPTRAARRFVAAPISGDRAVDFVVPQNGGLAILENRVEVGAHQVDVRGGMTVRGRDFGFQQIKQNTPPVAENATATTDEDTAVELALTASDAEGAALVYSIVTLPAHGQLSLSGSRATYDPDDNFHGPDQFTFRVNDGEHDSAVATVSITVKPVNDPPKLSANDPLAVDEGSQGNTIGRTLLQAQDVDDDAAGLLYTITRAAAHGALRLSGVPLVVGSTFTQEDIDQQRLVYDHAGGENTQDSFAFSLADGGEDAAAAVAAEFRILVTPVNDEESLNRNLVFAVDEGSSENVISPEFLQATDADLPAQPLTYAVQTTPGEGRILVGGAELTAGATFTQDDLDAGRVNYAHSGSEATADSFTFTVDDGVGAKTQGTFAIAVRPVNDPPTLAKNAAIAILEEETGVAISAAVLKAEDPDDASTELTYALLKAPSHGVLRVAGDLLAVNGTFTQADVDAGLISYDHDGSESSDDSFEFRLSDGGEDGVTGIVDVFRISIAPANDKPQLVANTGATFDEGSAENEVSAAMLRASDSDSSPQQLTYTLAALPENGTLRLSTGELAVGATFTQDDIDGGKLSYTHDGSETLRDGFAFRLSDQDGHAADAVFEIQIAPVNDPPTIEDQEILVFADHAGNFSFVANDPDTTELIFQVAAGPDHGTFEIDKGRYIYRPTRSYVGGDKVQVTVSDGESTSAPATITVRVRSRFQNLQAPLDTNGDGEVLPVDALAVINYLNRHGTGPFPVLADGEQPAKFYDVNGDALATPIDALVIINALNRQISAAEAEAAGVQLSYAAGWAEPPARRVRKPHADTRPAITQNRTLPQISDATSGSVAASGTTRTALGSAPVAPVLLSRRSDSSSETADWLDVVARDVAEALVKDPLRTPQR